MSEEPQALRAEANYLRAVANQLISRAKDLEGLAETLSREFKTEALVRTLEGLPFIQAKSGRCDWLPKDKLPSEVEALFDKEGQFKTERWHYSRTKDGNVLRFARKPEIEIKA